MMLIYKIRTNNAHLMFGLKEKVKLGWNQKSLSNEIMKNMEELDGKVAELLATYKLKNLQEAIEAAKTNKELDRELVYFMNKIYPEFQRVIIDKVELFNKKYCPNYEEILKQIKKS